MKPENCNHPNWCLSFIYDGDYYCPICGQHMSAFYLDYFRNYLYKSKKELDKTLEKANRNQVGGDHYTKLKIQPWDIIEANNLDFLSGNIIKYVLRAKEKGGLEDLEKAKHYLEKLIEIEKGKKNV